MATAYGMKSSVAFNKILVKCGILKKCAGGSYSLSEDYHSQGLSAVIEVPYFLPNGIKAFKKKSVWTEKGQDCIRKKFTRLGICLKSEQIDLFSN